MKKSFYVSQFKKYHEQIKKFYHVIHHIQNFTNVPATSKKFIKVWCVPINRWSCPLGGVGGFNKVLSILFFLYISCD